MSTVGALIYAVVKGVQKGEDAAESARIETSFLHGDSEVSGGSQHGVVDGQVVVATGNGVGGRRRVTEELLPVSSGGQV